MDHALNTDIDGDNDNSKENEVNEDRDPLSTLGKLTDWKNEPSVVNLKQDLTDARPDTDIHISNVDRWLDNLNITGRARKAKQVGKSNMVPKLIRKQAEWRYASLTEPFLSTQDVFNVSPVSAEDKQSAIQNELLLNNQFNTKINKVQFIDEYVRAAVDEGTVIVRVGWEAIEKEVEEEKPTFQYKPAETDEEASKVQELFKLAKEAPEGFAQVPDGIKQSMLLSRQHNTPIVAVQAGTEKLKVTKLIQNKPTVEVCNYKSISIDPTAKGDIHKAQFVIHSYETSLAYLKEDGRYTNLDKINIVGTSPLNIADHEVAPQTTFNFTDEPRKKFIIHEYWGMWDIHGTGQTEAIVAAWVGDVMVRLAENPYPDQKVPFVVAQYLPVRKSMYGEPDGELLEDNQKIVGAVTRGMIDIMGRSANGQTGRRKDALDATNARKYDKGLDYEFNPSVDPKQAFHMHTYPEIPQSAQFMLGLQNAEAESLTGVKAFSSGGGITGNALGDSVGGIKSALDASAKRELGILRRLAAGIKEIGRKVISMNAEYLSEEEVIRVTNTKFITVRKDDLPGNFDLKLSISTPEADAGKAQELAFMLQTTGQTMGPEFTKIILADIARLRKMPDLVKRIEEYQPKPDPMVQEKLKLEMELLKAQIQNEVAKANENNANAALDQAKAANISSDTDMKDLNFVEQESGTTQERALQRQGEQARSNMELKILESDLAKSKAPPLSGNTAL